MAVKNSRKIYLPDKTYHVYNRGIEGRPIFCADHEFRTFLYFLKLYLGNPQVLKREYPHISLKHNLFEEIDLLSFCLLRNHFHLLVHQKSADAVSKLLQRVCVSYSGYFNRAHNRRGTLYEGVYKATMSDGPIETLTLSRYINLNPIIEKVDDDFRIIRGKRLEEAIDYPYSSLAYILGKKQADWLRTDALLQDLKKCFGYHDKSLDRYTARSQGAQAPYLDFLKNTESGGGHFVDFS